MIDLTLLGSGGGMPIPERFLSSLIIEYAGRKILIDCGEGTQVAMRKFNTGFKTVDIICLTHFHGDHFYGLPGLLATIGNSNRLEPLTIIGPKPIRAILETSILPITYLPYDIYVVESPPEKVEIRRTKEGLRLYELDSQRMPEIILSTIQLDHSSPCLGYSFYLNRKPKFLVSKAMENKVPRDIWKYLQEGESIAWDGAIYTPDMVLGDERRGIRLSYITDSRPIEALADFIRGSDLFICEGTYGSDDDLDKAIENKHMTFREAANLALNGEVEELLLTHFSQSMDNPTEFKDNAVSVFANTQIGYDGWIKTLSYK